MLRKTNLVEIKINVACIVGGEFFFWRRIHIGQVG
jgi:hypothetical protein